MGTLRIAGAVNDSIVDGPGFRYVIFTQGCPHGCPGCHNPQTHDFQGGAEVDEELLWQEIAGNPLLSGVTLSGGEPFCQSRALLPLVRRCREKGLHIMAYSGYTLEELLALPDPAVGELLKLCDVLVDGRFVLAQRDLTLRFRGSRNQRILDVPASLRTGAAVVLDWDHPQEKYPPFERER